MRVTPRASRNAIEGIKTADDGREWLAVRLMAAPNDGAANMALVTLLSGALGVRKGDITMANGATSRMKRLTIKGDAARLISAVASYDGGQA